MDPTDTRKFAIKVTPNLFDRPTKIHDLTNEIRFLEECKHPNIVEHIQSYLWNKEIWTVMEYCNAGNLADVVQDEALTEDEACYVTTEILKGVAYLHECNKIHRDLKGDNILISSGVSIKIADFGLMTEASGDTGRTSICGSRYWMSPEMLKAEGYGTKSDVWSVGCIIYEMLTEGPPYIQFRSLKAIFYTATRGVEAMESSEAYTPQLRDFLSCTFQNDPRLRWSAQNLLSHPWIKECNMTQAQIMHSLRHLWSV
jgi:serine/threonine protein kinase